MASYPIALLTDFGLSDPYVGQMKAVLADLSPASICIDLCHHIQPFAVPQASFFLAVSLGYLPQNTIICAVVDPGVGTKRRIVALQTQGRIIVAPDNGILTLVPLQNSQAWDLSQAISISESSTTFHGRDLFAPLAAKLATGTLPGELGPACSLDSLVRLDGLTAAIQGERILTRALHVDRFGNVLLTAKVEDFNSMVRDWAGLRVLVPYGRPYARYVTMYADLQKDELGVLAGSQGYLELALNQGSAAEMLGLAPGMEIRLEKTVS